MGVVVRDYCRCNPEYLLHWFESVDLEDFSNPGPLPSINAHRVQEATLPLPPTAEQRAVARALRAVQEAKEARQRELVLERERKAALMEFLFTTALRASRPNRPRLARFPKAGKLWS